MQQAAHLWGLQQGLRKWGSCYGQEAGRGSEVPNQGWASEIWKKKKYRFLDPFPDHEVRPRTVSFLKASQLPSRWFWTTAMNLTLMQEFYDFNSWLDLAGKGGEEGWKEGRTTYWSSLGSRLCAKCFLMSSHRIFTIAGQRKPWCPPCHFPERETEAGAFEYDPS